MGDDESQQAALELKHKFQQREQATEFFAYFSPSIHTQLAFNRLAAADLQQQLQYWEATERFHEKLRLYFYPRIFEGSEVKAEKWDSFKVEQFAAALKVNWVEVILPLLSITFLVGGFGLWGLRRRQVI
jgi:ABC-2 type transport system permease protein